MLFEARPLRTALSIMAASAVVALTVAGGAFLSSSTLLRPARAQTEASAPTFVGSEACAGCHRPQAELWRSSQHRRAMDHATEASVLADFNDTSYDHAGVHSRFFRKDGKFFVETDGPDGKLDKLTFKLGPEQLTSTDHQVIEHARANARN